MKSLSLIIKLGRRISYSYAKRFISHKKAVDLKTAADEINFPQPVFDVSYYCNPGHRMEIEENIKIRKSRGNINLVLDIHEKLTKTRPISESSAVELRNQLLAEIGKIPNKLHESIKDLSDKPRVVNHIGAKREFNFKPKEFSELAKFLRVARSENLSNFTDHRSYFFMGQLAEMESALIHFSIEKLRKKGFQLISVPDILDKRVIESCGMSTEGERTQVSY